MLRVIRPEAGEELFRVLRPDRKSSECRRSAIASPLLVGVLINPADPEAEEEFIRILRPKVKAFFDCGRIAQ
jgi:hypothetical protein